MALGMESSRWMPGRYLALVWCMRLAGLQSPAGVRKVDSERNEAHGRPYCRKRGRSGVIVLLLLLLGFAVTGAEGYENDHDKMPPPPGGSLRQQLLEQDLRTIHCYTDDTIENLETLVGRLRERAKRHREEAKELDEEADEWHGRIKVLRQTLQGCTKQDQPEEEIYKLKFIGSLSNTIYAKNSLLQYSNGGPIEIVICSGDQIITSGYLSELEVEIVALDCGHTCKGDWTEEDFDHQIIRSLQGPQRVSVLEKPFLQLKEGKASLANIQFKEGSYRAGGNRFILAARVVGSRDNNRTTRVEEAFMDDYPFLVLTERSKANQKIDIPMLKNEVHSLKGIKKKGFYDERLKNASINTVQEFLIALNEDPEKLRCQILKINSKNSKPWRDMVEHAKECDLRNDRRLKSCTLQVKKREVTLFFNAVHDLVGAEFSGCFVAKGEFTEGQKVVVDDLLQPAYQELDTFDHIMEDNRPVNIHASGRRSIPISAAGNLGNASGIDCADGPLPRIAGQSAPEPSRSYHRNEIVNQAAENLGSASGIDCADGPLPGTAGQSAPEPFCSDHHNEIANQGIDCADGPLPGTVGQSAPEPSRSDHRNEIANQAAAEKLGSASGIDCVDGPFPGTAGQSAPEPSRSGHRNEIANQAAENLGSASGIDCVDGPLSGTTGQSAPEPSRFDHRNEIANQGQNHTPKGDNDDDASAFSVSDVPVAEIVNGTGRVYINDLDQQGENRTHRGGSFWEDYNELLAFVKESDKSNPALDFSSGWNFDLSTNANFGHDQAAAGNSASSSGNDLAPGAILGDTNRKSEAQKHLARQEQEQEQPLPELYAADHADDNELDELFRSLPPLDDDLIYT